MKIDSSIKSVSTSAVSAGGARSGKGAASAPNSGGGDRVQLSPLSSQLHALESSMADAVADSLLQTARELLRSRIG
jgi:hypothetical protein